MTLCAFTLHRISNAARTAAPANARARRPRSQHQDLRRPQSAGASRLNMHTLNSSASTAGSQELPPYMLQHSFSIPMRTRAAVLASLPITMADSNLCALASLSQWDSLPPGQHPSASLAQAAATRMHEQPRRAAPTAASISSLKLARAPLPQSRQGHAEQPQYLREGELIEDGQPFHLSAEHFYSEPSNPSTGSATRARGREAELELELRKTRDELASAKAWMREACERLGMPPPGYSQP
ncbi:hypothetical protein CF326_g4595 [Tilletia indica]|nr:hypothetical protein CF326_g4595 [Tilletia indica]